MVRLMKSILKRQLYDVDGVYLTFRLCCKTVLPLTEESQQLQELMEALRCQEDSAVKNKIATTIMPEQPFGCFVR